MKALSFSTLAIALALGTAVNLSAQTTTVVVPASPPPVVTPAPVPAGVTVVAPAGSVVAPGTTTTTTRTITSRGIIDAYTPNTNFIVRESTGPVTYTYGPQTVYATPGGVILTAEQVRTRMRAGLPVSVEYVPNGDARVIQRVVIDER